jgi:chromatin remodeling complex protein RSC6
MAKKTAKKATTAKKAAPKKATTAKKAAPKKATTAKKAAPKKATTAKKAAPKKATTAKKAAPKKATAKKVAAPKKKSARKPNAAFMRPLNPSKELAEVVGTAPIPRTEVMKKVWQYIKKHDLQDAKNRRAINADDKLKAVFGGKKQVTMFEMTKLVSNHLK